jgi:hypothetical protein
MPHLDMRILKHTCQGLKYTDLTGKTSENQLLYFLEQVPNASKCSILWDIGTEIHPSNPAGHQV